MWNIFNKTPFAAAGSFKQSDLTGDLNWLIAVKATIDIDGKTGSLTVAKEQIAPLDEDQYSGDPAQSILQYPCDFVLNKRHVDILLNANAHTPTEDPVTELHVGFGLGELSKILKVVGERVYRSINGLFFVQTTPAMFSSMPMNYENAFGGQEEENPKGNQKYHFGNPIGKGYGTKRRMFKNMDLPNIEYPKHPTKRKASRNKTAGFGPIPNFWSPRRDYIGKLSDGSQDGELLVFRPKSSDTLSGNLTSYAVLRKL